MSNIVRRHELRELRHRAQLNAFRFRRDDRAYRLLMNLADAADALDAYLARGEEDRDVVMLPGSMEQLMGAMKELDVRKMMESAKGTADMMMAYDHDLRANFPQLSDEEYAKVQARAEEMRQQMESDLEERARQERKGN